MSTYAIETAPGASGSSGRGGARYAGWVGLIVVVLSRAYIAFFLTLATMAVLPALGPWNSYVVQSNSMAPSIRAGDVVVAAPFDRANAIPVGRVMVFVDPTRTAGTGHDVLLVHRVVTDNKNGTYVTQGDANRAEDSTPLTAEAVRGQGRILVRFVGLPLLWLSNGTWWAFALWLLLTLVALYVVATSVGRGDASAGPGSEDPSEPEDQPGPTEPGQDASAGTATGPVASAAPQDLALPTLAAPAPQPGPGRDQQDAGRQAAVPPVPRWWAGVKVVSLVTVALAVIVATLVAPQGASGRFTAESVNGGNAWTSATFGTAQVTYPVDSHAYGANWTGSISGNAAAAFGKILKGVTLTIQDTTDGTYWTGADWITDPTPAALPQVPATGTVSWTYSLAASRLSSGDDYAVFATATDSASVPFNSPLVAWTFDSTVPTVAVTNPVSGSVYGANWDGTIAGTAGTSSPNVTLSGVALALKDTTTSRWWNGTAFAATSLTRVNAVGTTQWTYPLALSALTDAHAYSLVATVTDSAGNTQATPTVTFSIDTTGPTVAVTYPVSGQRYGPNWTGTLAGTATDPALAITRVTVRIQDTTTSQYWNGVAWQAPSTAVTATGTAAWTYPFAVSRLSDQHSYSVTAFATDTVGNVGTSSTVTFTVDLSANIAVAITYPASGTVYGANWSGVVTGTAADPSGDLSAVSAEIRDTTAGSWWNGTTWQATATTRPVTGTTAWSYALPATALTTEHNYSIKATATDSVGNSGTTTSTFGYLTSGVNVAVGYPANSATYGANWAGAVTGTATATGGLTVTRVNLTVRNTTNGSYWNGASWQPTSATVTATGTTAWTSPLPSSQLVTGNSYSAVATAVDNLSNTHSVTVPWTYVTTPPTVTITYPVSASTYGATWGGAISGTTTPNAAGFGIAAGATSVAVQDTTTGLWWNGTAFAASTQTYLAATGSTGWTYAMPAAALTSSHSYSVVARASDTGANVGTSASSSWTCFVASKLVITTQPSNSVAMAPISPAVKVAVQDAAGHVATTDSSTTITLTIGTNPGGATIAGGGPVTVTAGVATFSNVALDKAGTGYTLNALSAGLTSTTSAAFTISIGAAAKLAFTRQPSATAFSGSSFSTQPIVGVQDAYGNTVTSGSYSVKLTASGGTFSCSSNPKTTSSGSVTFSSCKITGSGTYTLTATATGLTPAVSIPIVVSYRQVAAPTNVAAVAGTTSGSTRVTFSASNPTTGVNNYTCSVYVNTGRTTTPVQGALITSATCSASGTNITVGASYTGTNSIVVIVKANPKTNYTAASSTPVVGSVAG